MTDDRDQLITLRKFATRHGLNLTTVRRWPTRYPAYEAASLAYELISSRSKAVVS